MVAGFHPRSPHDAGLGAADAARLPGHSRPQPCHIEAIFRLIHPWLGTQSPKACSKCVCATVLDHELTHRGHRVVSQHPVAITNGLPEESF